MIKNGYINYCANKNCGKLIGYDYAVDRQGTLPIRVCSSPCKTIYNQMKVDAEYKKEANTKWIDRPNLDATAEKISKITPRRNEITIEGYDIKEASRFTQEVT